MGFVCGVLCVHDCCSCCVCGWGAVSIPAGGLEGSRMGHTIKVKLRGTQVTVSAARVMGNSEAERHARVLSWLMRPATEAVAAS